MTIMRMSGVDGDTKRLVDDVRVLRGHDLTTLSMDGDTKRLMDDVRVLRDDDAIIVTRDTPRPFDSRVKLVVGCELVSSHAAQAARRSCSAPSGKHTEYVRCLRTTAATATISVRRRPYY